MCSRECGPPSIGRAERPGQRRTEGVSRVELTHFVLTRFSYRDAACRAGRIVVSMGVPTVNPLEHGRLERRFKLFELFCLPSVLAQTTKDFTWILLIDPQMKNRDRSRLYALTRGHRDTHLVEATSLDDLNYLGWLRPYAVRRDATHIATTNVDDDDLLGPQLLEHTHRYLRERWERRLLPSCTIVGVSNPPCWDFLPTRRAPLGYHKPWNGDDSPVFTGYTVCCRQPEYDVSALAFNHSLSAAYFNPAFAMNGDTQDTQAALRTAAEQAGEDWTQWRPDDHVHILRTSHPQVVVINHLENHSFKRLYQSWSDRRPVKGPADFPGMPVSFENVSAVIRTFRRSPSALIRHLYRRAQLVRGKWHAHERKRSRLLFQLLMGPVWFMKGSSEKRRR
jgi:Putative rhamnosyl transferase